MDFHCRGRLLSWRASSVCIALSFMVHNCGQCRVWYAVSYMFLSGSLDNTNVSDANKPYGCSVPTIYRNYATSERVT